MQTYAVAFPSFAILFSANGRAAASFSTSESFCNDQNLIRDKGVTKYFKEGLFFAGGWCDYDYLFGPVEHPFEGYGEFGEPPIRSRVRHSSQA